MAMSLAKTGTFIQAFPEPYYKDTLRAPVAPGQMARKLYELNSSRRSMGGTGNGSLSPRALASPPVTSLRHRPTLLRLATLIGRRPPPGPRRLQVHEWR